MKDIYRNEKVDIINLCDSVILYFNWFGYKQKNLELKIDWCGQTEFVDIYDFDSINTKMIFENISYFDLKANFRKDSMGALIIYDFNYEIDTKNRYNIYFDLVTNSNNYIKFICENFYFEITNK